MDISFGVDNSHGPWLLLSWIGILRQSCVSLLNTARLLYIARRSYRIRQNARVRRARLLHKEPVRRTNITVPRTSAGSRIICRVSFLNPRARCW